MAILHVSPLETGLVDDNLYAVKTGTVNFFIIRGEIGTVCFDSGFGKLRILGGLKTLGIKPEDITHLFLTHTDFDHTGGVRLFKNAEIYFSADEERMINGSAARKWIIHNPRIKRKYNLLREGDTVDTGELTILAIENPGHTPGSMSYLVNGTVLFSGDAFRLTEGRVYPVKHFFNVDTDRLKSSIRKLAALENVSAAYTAHWGYTKDCGGAMKEWKKG
jgi:hydroxyacylglutathione hydrolase